MISSHRRDDKGSVLVLVLVVSVVLSLVVVGIARYVSADLRYASVVEDRADALASAEGGLEYAVEKIRRDYPCSGSGTDVFTDLPDQTNGTTLSITCSPVGAGFNAFTSWAAVVTGEGVATDHLRITGGGDKTIGGRMYMTDPRLMNISGGSPTPGSGGVLLKNGDLFYDGSADDCATTYDVTDLDERFFLTPPPPKTPGTMICWREPWYNVVSEPPIPDLSVLPLIDQSDPVGMPYWTENDGCRVFEPGHYTAALDLDASNYFNSGVYYFDDVAIEIDSADITVGYPANVNYVEVLEDDSNNPICPTARAADGFAGGAGATWYLGGTSYIEWQDHSRLEMLPMAQNDGTRNHFVSIHVLGAGSINPSDLGGTDEILGIGPGANKEAVFQGRVWAPYQRVNFENVAGGADGQLLGGVVAASLWGDSNPSTGGFKIQVDTSPADYRLLVESTATKNGVEVTVRAVVEYRADEDFNNRVAVNSLRVLD